MTSPARSSSSPARRAASAPPRAKQLAARRRRSRSSAWSPTSSRRAPPSAARRRLVRGGRHRHRRDRGRGAGAVERFGGIDVVIANAGIATGGSVRTIDPAAWERSSRSTCSAAGAPSRRAAACDRAPRLRAADRLGRGDRARPFMAYCASKAGVEAFADCAADEVAQAGVDVGVAYFSWIDTDMVRDAPTSLGREAAARAARRGRSARRAPLSSRPGARSCAAIERRAAQGLCAALGADQPLAPRGDAAAAARARNRDAIDASPCRLADDRTAAADARSSANPPSVYSAGDVGAEGDEVEPPDLGPPADLVAQPVDERAGLLEEDPEQHRRAGARDRRAERAQLPPARPAPSSAGRAARGAAGAGGRRDRARSAQVGLRASPSVSSAACATLKVASASGTSPGSAARASPSAPAPRGSPRPPRARRAARASSRGRRAQITKPP